MNKFFSILAIFTIAASVPTAKLSAQVSPNERLFAERLAMLSLDARCHFFTPEQRRALNAFMLQSRGILLRGGSDIGRLNLIASQARAGAASKSCNSAQVTAEAARVKQAYSGWRMQMSANFPGVSRAWFASRAGLDNWRAWQDLGQSVRAGFVLAGNGLAFGIETPSTNIASGRIYLRDQSKIGIPTRNTNLQPVIRAGTVNYNATFIGPAQTKRSVDGPTRIGTLVLFPDVATRAIIALDPRDCFEIEIVARDGSISRYVVEVGDVVVAFALGAEI